MNLIVTGEVQSGKTTWCANYSQWLIEQKFTVGGVLCPEARNDDVKIGYDILDVQTNRSAKFGRFALTADFSGEHVGDYLVSYDGLEFARGAIQKALEKRYDIVFIDELGHLELAGNGIIESARMAYLKAPNTAMIIRKPLLTAFLEKLHLTDPQVRFRIIDLKSDTSYPLLERNNWVQRSYENNVNYPGRW